MNQPFGKLTLLILGLVAMSSFVANETMDPIGVYGVSESDSSQVQLSVFADHTFSYRDFSDVNRKIAVTGIWIQKGNKIFLKANNQEKYFHSEWTLVKNGNIAKSRRGVTFYRLCKLHR